MATHTQIKELVQSQYVERAAVFMQVPSAGNYNEMTDAMIAWQALSGRSNHGLDYSAVVGNMSEGTWVGLIVRAINKKAGDEPRTDWDKDFPQYKVPVYSDGNEGREEYRIAQSEVTAMELHGFMTFVDGDGFHVDTTTISDGTDAMSWFSGGVEMLRSIRKMLNA